MGGTGSGRWGGRPTVESALSLNIDELFRSGSLRRGADHASRWTWTNSYTGQISAEVVIVASLADADAAHIRLIHRDGDRTVADYRVMLESTVQPFGGVRWWFTCPVKGLRVGTLHLPRGAERFASRQAYRLGYRSERSSSRDRAIRKMHKLQRRLGGDPGRPSVPIEKPAYMHHSTFDRKLSALKAAETRACAYLLPAIEAMRRRFALRTID